MTQPRIFVASSSEGETIARELRNLLQTELGVAANVELWTHKFELSQVVVESLESVANEADFAVLVLTADDTTVSRHKSKMAPRDNLIFESGLFIGALGRERSFVVRDQRAELKLPSDIAGLNTGKFDTASPEALAASLRLVVNKLAAPIRKLGLRPKWLASALAAQAQNAAFHARVEGMWWERIHHPTGSALSTFDVQRHALTGELVLEGASYLEDGTPAARWKSEMVRAHPAERSLVYLWRGSHPLPDQAHLKFHGYANVDFDAAAGGSPRLTRASGIFWDVNEANPTQTVAKPVQLLRVTDEKHERTLRDGTQAEKAALVRKVLAAWAG